MTDIRCRQWKNAPIFFGYDHKNTKKADGKIRITIYWIRRKKRKSLIKKRKVGRGNSIAEIRRLVE